MKSTTFARLALFLPYLLLLESVIYFVFRDIEENNSFFQTFNIIWNFLAIFWVLPYSILVVLLLVQSKGKTFPEIKHLYQSAPFKLMAIAPTTYTVILMVGSLLNAAFFESSWRLLLMAAIISVPASLVIGFAFVGISLLLHKLSLKVGLIKDEDIQLIATEIQNQQSRE